MDREDFDGRLGSGRPWVPEPLGVILGWNPGGRASVENLLGVVGDHGRTLMVPENGGSRKSGGGRITNATFPFGRNLI